MDVFDKGLCTILLCNLLYVLLSLPLIFRRVPPNPLYGYRTRTTLSNDGFWYDANAYFATRFLGVTLMTTCLSLALHAWHGLAAHTFMQISIGLLVAPVVIAWLLTARFIHGVNQGTHHA
ncbi:MAG: hypothetical protein BWK76_15310 [Desulfobulbaceae bacterium A2]|nr:MAG: hypothetical protein BWK76_15310 [Desulfobulbaceae bacterium A2]